MPAGSLARVAGYTIAGRRRLREGTLPRDRCHRGRVGHLLCEGASVAGVFSEFTDMRDSGDGRPHARRSAVAMLDAIPVHPTDLTDLSAEEAQCFPDCERSAQVLSGFARQLAISSPEGGERCGSDNNPARPRRTWMASAGVLTQGLKTLTLESERGGLKLSQPGRSRRSTHRTPENQP